MLETILTPIVEAVFSFIAEKTAPQLWERLKGNPVRNGFKVALSNAYDDFERLHQIWVRAGFDASFLKTEGAPTLAQYLLVDGKPDADTLAEAWANSIGRARAGQAEDVGAIRPAIEDFLHTLESGIVNQPELREIVQLRQQHQQTHNLQQIAQALGKPEATAKTERGYLEWVIDQHLYIDLRGTLQTEREVRLRLDEIFITLQAMSDRPTNADKRLAEALRAELQDDLDDDPKSQDFLERHWSRKPDVLESITNSAIDLSQVVKEHAKAVILGDPGSGKSTLLKYLALMHAQACLEGRHGQPDPALGTVKFPIFLRIAEYAEGGHWQRQALSEFLPAHFAKSECPSEGLADLIQRKLAQGECLLLLDGLDEITEAEARRGVVNQIEQFVRRHDGPPNRFVVTSRVAGYRGAPLGEGFAHYVVQDMGLPQIEAFLNRWCLAVEAQQAPDLSVQAQRANAQREIDAVLGAIKNSDGVRRLAGNPLMLRTLATIHRIGKQLPDQRIELYKLATETLARTWHTAKMGVRLSPLLQEEYITPLLSNLAYWMHLYKPTGLASEAEVMQQLGESWAELNGIAFDRAKELPPKIMAEVREFLTVVREQTGLFVERAPGRFGFMHLTFEEYYAARYLVSSSRLRMKRIYERKHNPRWQEPVLLAIGFVALSAPEDAKDLVEAAILAQGEEAEYYGFKPSAYEEYLGRDYLLALRCLGDRIPVHAATLDKLLIRLVAEWVYGKGLGRFERYRETLSGLAPALGRNKPVAAKLIASLIKALGDEDSDVRARAAENLGHLRHVNPEVIVALAIAMHDGNAFTRSRVAVSLGQLGLASLQVIDVLTIALRDDAWPVRYQAAASLGHLRQSHSELMPMVSTGLVTTLRDDNEDVRSRAAASLGQLGQSSPEIIGALVKTLREDDSIARYSAANALTQMGTVHLDMMSSFLHDHNSDVRLRLVDALGHIWRSESKVIELLVKALSDEEMAVRICAAESLGHLGQGGSEVFEILIEALHDDDAATRTRAAENLGQLRQTNSEVVAALIDSIGDISSDVRYQAATSLGQIGQTSPEIFSALTEALFDEDSYVRYRASASLGQLGQASPAVMTALIETLDDDDTDIRYSAVTSLGQLGQTNTDVIEALGAALQDQNSSIRYGAAVSLWQLDQTANSLEIVSILQQTLIDAGANSSVKTATAKLLGEKAPYSDELLVSLIQGLLQQFNNDRSLCVNALGQLGRRYPERSHTIAKHLINAFANADFSQLDSSGWRSGSDYIFIALSELAATGVLDREQPSTDRQRING